MAEYLSHPYLPCMSLAQSAPRPYRPPAPWPHTERLGRLGLLMGLRDNPIATWGVWHFEEPVVAAKTVIGHVTVVSDPAGIKRILVEETARYPKDPLQMKVLRPGLGEGLLTAEGDLWRRVRRTLAPLFTPRAVDRMASAMAERAGRMAKRLSGLADGTIIDVPAEATRVTFDVLSGTLFSDDIVGDSEAFARALGRYFATQGRLSPLDAIGAPDWIPRIGRLRARPAIHYFEETVARIIARRRARIAAGDAPDDILTRLIECRDPETGLGLSEEEIGANIVTFIGAGHETTANTLSWTLFLLAKHPAARERAEAEAERFDPDRAAGALDEMPFLRAVVEESLRLYPPASTLSRAAVADDTVAGVAVPKGSLMVVSPWVVGRHRRLWPEADYFRPERFLGDDRSAIDRLTWLAFGAGPRVCIGQRFAMLELVIVLAELLRHVRLEVPAGLSVSPRQTVTLRPWPALPMRLSRRRRAA